MTSLNNEGDQLPRQTGHTPAIKARDKHKEEVGMAGIIVYRDSNDNVFQCRNSEVNRRTFGITEDMIICYRDEPIPHSPSTT